MKASLIDDLSTLTTISKNALEKLFSERSTWCICNDLQEALLAKDLPVEIDIGIGTLMLGFDADDTLKYKFIPSGILERSIQKLIVEGENPLIRNAEQTLATRIVKTYKDFI